MFSKEALVEAVWVDVEGVRFCFVNAILKAHHCERMPSAMPTKIKKPEKFWDTVSPDDNHHRESSLQCRKRVVMHLLLKP